MKIYKNVIFLYFGRSSFLAILTFEGYFGNYEKFVCFLKNNISGKNVVDFQIFKRAQDHQKPTSFDLPNVLNKLLSKNLTLTRRCEVNKFNLVTYFSLYKYQPCDSLITQFSRPRIATILSSFSLVSSSSFFFSTNKLLIFY